MKKVLIIGVNSFLGVNLAHLLKLQFEVTGVYHQNTDNLSDLSIKTVSFAELSSLKDEYETVYFVSAYIPSTKSSVEDEKLFEVNINLLKKCLSIFTSAKIILSSSVSVYGQCSETINEKTTFNTPSTYGLSKLWAENIVKEHHSYTIFRISSMYGVGMKIHTFLPQLIKNALIKNEIKIFGNGNRLQNYIHVHDVASMMVKASFQKENNLFLAVNTESYSNLEIANMVLKKIPDAELIFEGIDNSLSYIYDAGYTYDSLNYKPSKTINMEIVNLIQWIKEQF